MNHEAYENEMIDRVNRHAVAGDEITFDNDGTDTIKSDPVKNAGMKTLGRGLGRVMLALLTAGVFGLSVFDFIMVATATGYVAVVLFFAAIILLFAAITLLYIQGRIHEGRQGDDK